MVYFSRLFLSLSLVAASLAAPAKRTVAQVEADIATISSQVTALDNDINGFPASGLLGALDIHSAAGTLETALDQATSDVTATGPLDEADGTTILNAVEAIEPTIINALTSISTKQADFAAEPISGLSALVLVDLQTLQTDTDGFGNALIANAPADLVATAQTILANINAAFSTAIAAYE
ncbi:hydrophobic surface binding protein [Mycena maculata]|uniref:Hydrophobic surface binding protein n=1 Tax=Mycena maculata TaxID=230809 RepID=A0AAD7IXJ5_9AGAR|nr:hydrophobic surface binding protein [Mycena maculata]